MHGVSNDEASPERGQVATSGRRSVRPRTTSWSPPS